jgi:cell division protein FtsB
MNLLKAIVSEARKRLLGISADEIRYTFEDVRAELRATRAELKAEIEKLRKELDALPSRQDRVRGPEVPVAEA